MNIHTQANAASIRPCTKEENAELYPRLAANDAGARKRVIEGNMALVVSVVDQYVLFFPKASHLRDDLISEGLLALAQAVDSLCGRPIAETPNVASYLCRAVQRATGEMVDEELHLQAPSRTVMRRRKRGEPIVVPSQVELEPSHLDRVQDPVALTDLRDLIASCCETDEEWRIIAMREESHTYQDIAVRLGIPVTTAFILSREVYRRFLEKSGMKGEV